jgi:hypothetical protein
MKKIKIGIIIAVFTSLLALGSMGSTKVNANDAAPPAQDSETQGTQQTIDKEGEPSTQEQVEDVDNQNKDNDEQEIGDENKQEAENEKDEDLPGQGHEDPDGVDVDYQFEGVE